MKIPVHNTYFFKQSNGEQMRLPDTQVIANILGYMYSNIFPNRFKRLYKCTLPSSVYIHEKLGTIGSV